MNLNQLRYFLAVGSLQSISKAAEHLHISQPSLSANMRDLENEFGVTLFTRHYRGVRLTEEGQTLYALGKDLLSRADQASAVMKDLGSGRKFLKLGVPPMIGSLILPKLYRGLAQEDISLEITEGGYHHLLGKLIEKELDLAFLPHTGPLDPSVSGQPAAMLEVCCCAAKGHPLTAASSVDPSDLKQTPLVLFENSFLQTERILQWFQSKGVTPNILLQTQQLSTMVQMLESGLAVGFLFRELIDAHPGLTLIPTAQPIRLQVSLARLSSNRNSRAMDCFFRYFSAHNPFEQ